MSELKGQSAASVAAELSLVVRVTQNQKSRLSEYNPVTDLLRSYTSTALTSHRLTISPHTLE